MPNYGEEKALWLVWQDSKTRLRHVVGKLWIKKNKYFFVYEKDGLQKAKESGYSLHPFFPEIEKVYKSKTLFPAFARRLPNKDRPDYINLLNKHGLSLDSSDFDILMKTGGKLATDNYEFVPVLNSCKNEGITHEFYLAGWKYWEGPNLQNKDLSPGTSLKIIPEPENKYDKFALQIITKNGHKIGYIPSFYSKLISHHIAKGCQMVLTVLEYNPKNESSKVLKLKLKCLNNCN